MTTGKGLTEQVERNKTETTYTKLTTKILKDALEQLSKNPPKERFAYITLDGFGYLCFNLIYKYPEYGYYYVYHKRIKVYEFRFYKKYRQNVEFREYYNSKYEKINK